MAKYAEYLLFGNVKATVRLQPLMDLLNYVTPDEHKDWLECGEPESGHVYLSIKKLWEDVNG
jgi:hypothetical protein